MMILEVYSLWSPDLDPVSEGLPPNPKDFNVFVQVAICEAGKPGTEVFGIDVVSPSQLALYESGHIVSHTLVLDHFDWDEIRKRIQKLLAHVSSVKDWDEVIQGLAGFLSHNDV